MWHNFYEWKFDHGGEYQDRGAPAHVKVNFLLSIYVLYCCCLCVCVCVCVCVCAGRNDDDDMLLLL